LEGTPTPTVDDAARQDGIARGEDGRLAAVEEAGERVGVQFVQDRQSGAFADADAAGAGPGGDMCHFSDKP
jgi:hypothetical protein